MFNTTSRNVISSRLLSIQKFQNSLPQYWDENIAKIAQHLADSCSTSHDQLREVPGQFIYVFTQNRSIEQYQIYGFLSIPFSLYMVMSGQQSFPVLCLLNLSHQMSSFRIYNRVFYMIMVDYFYMFVKKNHRQISPVYTVEYWVVSNETNTDVRMYT